MSKSKEKLKIVGFTGDIIFLRFFFFGVSSLYKLVKIKPKKVKEGGKWQPLPWYFNLPKLEPQGWGGKKKRKWKVSQSAIFTSTTKPHYIYIYVFPNNFSFFIIHMLTLLQPPTLLETPLFLPCMTMNHNV